jgi:hypothetical protein
VRVLAGGAALGVGGDFSATLSAVEFVDQLSEIQPSVFDGQARYAGIGVAFGFELPPGWPRSGGGYGCSYLALGGAVGSGCGKSEGLELGLSFGVGFSSVQEVIWDCCSK